MRRYRLYTNYQKVDPITDAPDKDSPKRYSLIDEQGQRIYREDVTWRGWLSGEENEARWERITFATPEEAWASIKDIPCIPADTPLYKYTFYIKNGGVNFVYISEDRKVDRVDNGWIGLKTTDDEHVTISLVELLRFVVREV